MQGLPELQPSRVADPDRHRGPIRGHQAGQPNHVIDPGRQRGPPKGQQAGQPSLEADPDPHRGPPRGQQAGRVVGQTARNQEVGHQSDRPALGKSRREVRPTDHQVVLPADHQVVHLLVKRKEVDQDNREKERDFVLLRREVAS